MLDNECEWKQGDSAVGKRIGNWRRCVRGRSGFLQLSELSLRQQGGRALFEVHPWSETRS
jgi:hypothetical protein